VNLIDNEILKFLGEVEDGISSKVSPKVSDSLEIVSEPGVHKLLGWEWIFEAYETGRGATVNTTAGSPTLQESLAKWFKGKGLAEKEAIGKSWNLSKRIHKEGTLLFKNPKTGFLTDFFNESKLNNLSNRIGISWKAEILNELKTI